MALEKLLRTLPVPWTCSLLLLCSTMANAQIIDESLIESTDTQSFRQEIDLFTTIQQGIFLSVVECELLDSCNASVNRSEVDQIISIIDSRVNMLSLRYTETGDQGLESILVGYVDVRDSYKMVLEKMASIPVFAGQQDTTANLDADDFFTGTTNRGGALSNDLMQLFQDADDELVDDDIIEEVSPP